MAEPTDPDDWPVEATLPPRTLLENYAVPDLPVDFTDRVLGSLHPQSPAKPARAPWIIAAISGGFACAAALALVLVQRDPSRSPTPAADAPPSTPTPTTPVPVAAPTSIALPPQPAPTGDLVIQVEPRDATVRVDGVAITGASGSPFVRTNLSPGPHLVEVVREGFTPWSQQIDVPAHALPLSIALERATIEPFLPRTPTKRTPRPSRSGSPDLKDPFGAATPPPTPPDASPDLEDPFGK